MSKISSERKITYYIGFGITILGFILFFSVFISVAGMFTNLGKGFNHFPNFANGFIGFILIVVGSAIRNIGAKGVAGSGILLDPDKAREDLRPFNEAKGNMINDVISNIDVVDKLTDSLDKKEVIKIKCRSCGTLNDEDAEFCKGCGGKL